MPALPPFNPYLPEFITDPYPIYARYRALDPVHWGLPQAPGRPGCWYLFRYDDIVALLKDRRFVRKWPPNPEGDPFAAVPEAQRPFLEMSSRWLLSSDPPAHTRLRGLVNKAFTPSVVEDLRPRVQQLADDLIAAAERAGTFDLIGDVAFPLSFTVITEILGVRPEDLDTFRKWSSTVGDGINLRQGTQSIERASAATLSLMDYFRAVVADRRHHSRPDLISRLVEARDMHDRLSEDELLSMCIQLIFAGHETTVNHIGNGMLALLRHPEQRELLRRRPDLIDGAVNELLRLDSPVQTCAARKPIEDVEIGGKRVRAGEPVIAFVGAANRDPDVFPEPDRLDITRDGAAHLAFGTGIHACLAGALARMEGAIAIGTLLERLPDLRLVDAPLEWRPHAVLRGLAALPVSVR